VAALWNGFSDSLGSPGYFACVVRRFKSSGWLPLRLCQPNLRPPSCERICVLTGLHNSCLRVELARSAEQCREQCAQPSCSNYSFTVLKFDHLLHSLESHIPHPNIGSTGLRRSALRWYEFWSRSGAGFTLGTVHGFCDLSGALFVSLASQGTSEFPS
jgi:hypothetical protein